MVPLEADHRPWETCRVLPPRQPLSASIRPMTQESASSRSEAPARVQMNVRVDPALRDAVDARRALLGLSRDAWVTRALHYALDTTTPPQEGTTP